MILDGEDWEFAMMNSLYCVVIQIEVTDLQSSFEAVGVHSVAMILGSDVYFPSSQLLHWVIGPSMSELQFKGRGSEGAGY